MTSDEVLLSVHIPFTQEHEFTREFKQSPRRDDDIAIVNAGKLTTPDKALPEGASNTLILVIITSSHPHLTCAPQCCQAGRHL